MVVLLETWVGSRGTGSRRPLRERSGDGAGRHEIGRAHGRPTGGGVQPDAGEPAALWAIRSSSSAMRSFVAM